MKEVANRKGGDESPEKKHKSNPHPAHMEEATADKVQEEVKEKTDSEDSPPDDEEDWLAKVLVEISLMDAQANCNSHPP